MAPRILVLQHHPTAPAGLLGERMAARAARVTTLQAEAGIDLPDDAAAHDGLVILGGAMNAYDDQRCRHFPTLLELARTFAATGRPVLGICLGAQLLARAWGGTVHLGAAPEFGVVPLAATPEAEGDPLLAGAAFPAHAMQWHDDTFDLPEVAVPLLTGAACRNQGFRVAGCVWGFQCHLEADRRAMIDWAVYRRDVYGDADRAESIAREAAAYGAAAERFGRDVADRWLDLVAEASTA